MGNSFFEIFILILLQLQLSFPLGVTIGTLVSQQKEELRNRTTLISLSFVGIIKITILTLLLLFSVKIFSGKISSSIYFEVLLILGLLAISIDYFIRLFRNKPKTLPLLMILYIISVLIFLDWLDILTIIGLTNNIYMVVIGALAGIASVFGYSFVIVKLNSKFPIIQPLGFAYIAMFSIVAIINIFKENFFF